MTQNSDGQNHLPIPRDDSTKPNSDSMQKTQNAIESPLHIVGQRSRAPSFGSGPTVHHSKVPEDHAVSPLSVLIDFTFPFGCNNFTPIVLLSLAAKGMSNRFNAVQGSLLGHYVQLCPILGIIGGLTINLAFYSPFYSCTP